MMHLLPSPFLLLPLSLGFSFQGIAQRAYFPPVARSRSRGIPRALRFAVSARAGVLSRTRAVISVPFN